MKIEPVHYLELLADFRHFILIGERQSPFINSITSIKTAGSDSLTWLNSSRNDADKLLADTKAGFIVVKSGLSYFPKEGQMLIEVDNPKLFFTLISNKIFNCDIKYSIHETAIVSKHAIIHNKVSIGPYCIIGDSKIGEGTRIESHCNIGDNTIIGSNVFIGSGTKVANVGFGFATSNDGRKIRFPHIGGVVIEDDVEIGSNVCIDRGALSDTVIKKGVKIDNLVHIAHNVVIGERSCVVAMAMIGGSTAIGVDTWIGPSSSLRDVLNIGDSSLVGLGSVVTKNIPSGEVWVGNPAKKMK